MNTLLDSLHRYPFERLNQLLDGVVAGGAEGNIALSLGEPKHAAPQFILDLLADPALLRRGLGTYPATRGIPELRAAIARWLERRYAIEQVDPETHVLPVNGTREALFAVAQALITPDEHPNVLLPNPFYQIYEGAALLAGARPVYVNCTPAAGFLPAFDAIPGSAWSRCALVFVNSPHNPCGRALERETFARLIELADRYDFIIASDECYSELYFDDSRPPIGLLEVCAEMGRRDFHRCLAFNSLSKRSNLPGLRSGLVAGDAQLIEQFLLYRTYHGSAMPLHSQIVSAAAWADEAHVAENRAHYREKFARVLEILAGPLAVEEPDGGFYLWPDVRGSDVEFARTLYREQNVTVLPGTYLSRESEGVNPGEGRVRMALVATLAECVEAAERLAAFLGR